MLLLTVWGCAVSVQFGIWQISLCNTVQCCTWEHTGREAQRQILDKLIFVGLSILFDKLGYLMTVVFVEHTVVVFCTFPYTFISSNAALL